MTILCSIFGMIFLRADQKCGTLIILTMYYPASIPIDFSYGLNSIFVSFLRFEVIMKSNERSEYSYISLANFFFQ